MWTKLDVHVDKEVLDSYIRHEKEEQLYDAGNSDLSLYVQDLRGSTQRKQNLQRRHTVSVRASQNFSDK
jgi:hypothetical protein